MRLECWFLVTSSSEVLGNTKKYLYCWVSTSHASLFWGGRPPLTSQPVPQNRKLCAESQHRSNKPETATFDFVTGNDKSKTALVGSRDVCVELQSGFEILLETNTNLFLAGGERTSLWFSCLTGGWPQYSQAVLLTLSNSSHSHSVHSPLRTPGLSTPYFHDTLRQ